MSNKHGIQGVYHTKAVERRIDQSVHIWSIQVYEETGTTARRSGSARLTNFTAHVIDEQMSRDDEINRHTAAPDAT